MLAECEEHGYFRDNSCPVCGKPLTIELWCNIVGTNSANDEAQGLFVPFHGMQEKISGDGKRPNDQ